MKKNLLAGVIAALFVSGASAFEPFVVKDIRVEGIQRTEAGTVFSYLPVKVGERFTDDKAAQAIHGLDLGFEFAGGSGRGVGEGQQQAQQPAQDERAAA